ncbi:hypothetical protein DCC62_25560, partial [candidate division KSB1 bacterium]
WSSHDRQRRYQPSFRRAIRERVALTQTEGRWFLTNSFGVLGRESGMAERAERQARLLLQRYGILVKEWYRRESGLLHWPQLFHVLKRLEWQGEIRRGYFIAGLSGVQFALPEAVALLQKLQTEPQLPATSHLCLSTIDPALPFGGVVDWDFNDLNGNKIAVTRAASNHLLFWNEEPAAYCENFASRLWLGEKWRDEMNPALIAMIKSWLRVPAALRSRARIEILQINGENAKTNKLAETLLQNGFESEGEKLVLWPSAV